MQSFNWVQYITNYPDLQEAGISTYEHAWKHYIRFGTHEGRTCDNLKYIVYDEHGNDCTNVEVSEQQLAREYIKPDDIVLELGARYGSVSCCINKKLKIKTNQVVVEPDQRVWDSLELNKKINNCGFHIVKGFVSNSKLELTDHLSYNGYGTTTIKSNESSIPSYTLESIQKQTGLTFNVLVADCEGFLETFFDENPGILTGLRLILFEADRPDICDYQKIVKKLESLNFKEILGGHQNVFIR
jgi:FkbM family methyltransferase